jgi:hypothetical protein
MRQSRWRWWVVGFALVVVVAAVLTGRAMAPTWAQAVAGVCLVMLFARLGRPRGGPSSSTRSTRTGSSG